METTEVEKSTGSEDVSQLNRNRSFKSKQLVRSQAIRETHSPPRAISPAHRSTPTVTISTTTVGNSTLSITNSVTTSGNSAPAIANSAPNAGNSATNRSACSDVKSPRADVSSEVSPPSSVSAEKVNERTVNVSEDSSHSIYSDAKISDSEERKKKLPVEIQITSGGWDNSHHDHQRTRRWHSDTHRDLLSNNPRICCVCGTCAACAHCRGRRRRHYCPTKQDSGIVCSDDCADCSDNDTGGSNNDVIRKSSSLDMDDQSYYCRCPERKERPKNISLSRNDSDDRYEPTGPELVAFLKDTLNKNVRDRMALLKIERELHALVNDTSRCIVRFPVMTSYGRMLVHRCASLFQLSHHLDQTTKTAVLVSKSGTSGGRIPCTSFREWCTATFPPASPARGPPPHHQHHHHSHGQHHQTDATHAKSILKRDTQSLEEPGAGSLASNRSKSLEQREKDYERVRRRIFSSQEEAQWPWLTSGPIRLLTAEGGRNKLLKVQSLEGNGPGGAGTEPSPAGGGARGARGAVAKSHSFGGYAATQPHAPRLLSRQGDLASSSWRLSPSSSGYKTLSLRSTDSVTPSPTGGASPEPTPNVGTSIPVSSVEGAAVVWAVTDMAAVPAGAMVIHPQTGRPLTNPDGSVYQFDPANPPVLYDPAAVHNDQQKLDPCNEKRRGRLEKQHSFIDNDCECQPSEECRNKCCCECRRHETQKTTTEKETNTKPPTPLYETNTQNNAQETANQLAEQPNQEQEHYEETANQQQVYEQTPNQKPYEAQRSYEAANSNAANNVLANRQVQSTNEVQEVQYQQYSQGYNVEEVTSPPQLVNQYVPHDVNMQMMPQAKVAPLPIPDPNIRPMSLSNMTNVVYPAMAQGYPYQCRVDPSLQMYQQVLQPEEQKLAPSPHQNETAFRIDPSYPYAAVDYTAACGHCADTSTVPMQHQQRSYSVPYGQVEVPQVLPPYPVGNMLIPQPHLQPYPQYQQEAVPWAAPKLVVPELYPMLQYPTAYHQPHYSIVYPQPQPQPQVIPQHYPFCQPVYPVIDKQPDQRRNSFSNRQSKQNSVSGSARNTPLQEDKGFEEKGRTQQNTDIAATIQQIKNQMAQLNTRDSRFDKDRRRRNSGNGLLGSCPVNNFNGRVVGRSPHEDGHLSSAARAIVNTIRNMQTKNTYQDTRRDYQRYDKQDRPDFRRRYDRDDNKMEKEPPRPSDGQPTGERYDVRNRGFNMPVYRQPYLFRQMSPGTWCRRSPGPVHPVLNPPRRPHPDTRNPRR